MRLGSLPKFIHPSRRDEPVSRNTPRRTLWLALVSASLGCDSVFTEPFAYGAVDVTVTLPDDRGVPGLDLTLYSGSRHHAYAVTDSTGAARFEFVPEGPLGVSIAPDPTFRPAAHPDGYYQTFRMREGQEVGVDFEFIDTRGTIEVLVATESGTLLPGQTVELYNAWEGLARAETDEHGRVVFEFLPRGDFGVRVVASPTCEIRPDRAFQDGLVVEAGERFEVTIVLENC